MNIKKFLKNEKYTKIIVGVLVFLLVILLVGVFAVRAEDNTTRKKVILKEWTTQLLYDTTNACYQGTIRWIVLTNPNLIGQTPGWQSQRQMIVHCFCVMERIRKEITIKEYQKNVFNQEWTGNLFMTKALECIKEEKTLPSFFVIEGEKGIKSIPTPKEMETENSIVVPDGETEDSQEESPDQKQEESEGSPETIFQG
jgi:hypothetical protein